MKLITPELIERFKEVGEQGENENPLIVAKFFAPVGSATWYATEYDAETNICYGYVTGLADDEWGFFSITEMEALKLPFGLGIERDIHFKETPFNTLFGKNRESELHQNQSQEREQDFER